MKVIVAMDKNNVIGVNNDLPWKIPSDMRHFIRHTKNKTVLMGRKTFESINSNPLPNRSNVVFSRSLERRDIIVERTFTRAKLYKNAVVIGGGELYKYVVENSLADELIVTRVNIELPYNEDATLFPDFSENYKLVSIITPGPLSVDERDENTYKIMRYKRI